MRTYMDMLLPLFCLSLEWRPPPGLSEAVNAYRKTTIEQLLTLDRAPRGYIWHHHQDVGRMQLVQEEAHILSRPHTGGMAIWGGGH